MIKPKLVDYSDIIKPKPKIIPSGPLFPTSFYFNMIIILIILIGVFSIYYKYKHKEHEKQQTRQKIEELNKLINENNINELLSNQQ